MIDENGEILNPMFGQFFLNEDLYQVFHCDNTSGFLSQQLVVEEIWANETEFIGYIVKRANDELLATWILELLDVYKEGKTEQSARGAKPIPALLNKL